MLAAAADSGPGCEALLGGAATLELADALGRTALMFAAGNDACVALASLLDAGASVRQRPLHAGWSSCTRIHHLPPQECCHWQWCWQAAAMTCTCSSAAKGLRAEKLPAQCMLLLQVAARDKRGRCVSEYAPPGSKAAEVLAAHLAVLQAASDASQVRGAAT